MKEKIINAVKQYPALITAALLLPYFIVKALKGGDFVVYLAAAEQLRSGKDCYNVWLHYQGGDWASMYGYSPFFAVLLIPFSYLPAYIPQLLFLVADVFMIFRMLRLLEEWLQIQLLPHKKWWYALMLLFSVRFILHNFEMVQLNIFILWLSIEGLNQVFGRKNIALGALLLALGINFKILPLLFVPYLLWRGQFKAFGWIALFSIVFIMLPAFLLGYDFNMQLHREWFAIINPLADKYNAGQNADGCRVHGLAALVAAYFSKNVNGDFQLLITEMDSKTQFIIVNALRLLLACITLFFLRTAPFKTITNKRNFITEVAYILLITPLLFPQQNKWAFICMAPALAVIFYQLLKQERILTKYISVALLTVIFILTTLTTDGIIGRQLNYYTECLKLVTIGTLLIVPLLCINVPDYKASDNKKAEVK